MAAIAEATTDKPHTNEEKNNIFGIYLNLIELNVNACRDAMEKDKSSLEATTKMIAHQEEVCSFWNPVSFALTSVCPPQTLMDLGNKEQNIEAEIEKQKKLLESTRAEKEMQEKQFVLFKELRVSTTADLEQKGIALEQLVQNRLSAESESVECNRNCELVRRLPKEKKFQKLTEAEVRLVLLEAGLGRTDSRLKGWVGQTLTVKLERDPMRLKSALDLTVIEMAKMRHTIFLWDSK